MPNSSLPLSQIKYDSYIARRSQVAWLFCCPFPAGAHAGRGLFCSRDPQTGPITIIWGSSPALTRRTIYGIFHFGNRCTADSCHRSWSRTRHLGCDQMSRAGNQKKKPINQTGRRTALTFRVVLLPSFFPAARLAGGLCFFFRA